MPLKIFMKQFFILLAVILLAGTSCKKENIYGVDCSENKTKAIQTETDSIARYIEWRNSNGANINAILHPNGFYYQVITPGEGSGNPETCSTINVDYKGRRFGGAEIEGTVFDSAEGASMYLYQTISGWQQALPLLVPGGKIEIFLPPSLGYGANGSGSIKGNTYLFFEITLNSFS